MTSPLEQEIHEQPAALERLLVNGKLAALAAAERIRAFGPAFALLAARGSSDNAARYAQYLLGAHDRLAAGLAVPSLHTLHAAPPRLDRALVIGVSLSGQSPDVVAVVSDARAQGAATLAVTGDASSPLASAAEHCLLLACGPERSVAASKSYTNQLMALAMLSAALSDDAARWRELVAIPAAIADALRAPIDDAGVAALARAERFIVLGRGFHYATAFEIALKMKELCYVLAEPYSPADLLHGPVAVLEPGFPVVLVAPTGKGSTGVESQLDTLARRGVRLVALSDRDDVLARAHLPIRLPAGVPEWLSPIVAAVPGQRFALALALARGIDPDHPRGLSKVTRTR